MYAASFQSVAVRRQLTDRGWRRYHGCFTNQCLEREFLHALQPLFSRQSVALEKASGL